MGQHPGSLSLTLRKDVIPREAGKLHQGHPRLTVFAGDDCSVGGRRQCRDNRGLKVVGRWNAGRFDLVLLAVPPVVVGGDQGAILIVDFQGWISKCAVDSLTGQRRAERPDQQVGRTGSFRMKPPIMTLSPDSTNPRVLIFAS